MFTIYNIQRRRIRNNLEQPRKTHKTLTSIKVTYNAIR